MVSSRRAKLCRSVPPNHVKVLRPRSKPQNGNAKPRKSVKPKTKRPKPCTSVAPQVRATKQAQRTKSRPKPCTNVTPFTWAFPKTVYKCCANRVQTLRNRVQVLRPQGPKSRCHQAFSARPVLPTRITSYFYLSLHTEGGTSKTDSLVSRSAPKSFLHCLERKASGRKTRGSFQHSHLCHKDSKTA